VQMNAISRFRGSWLSLLAFLAASLLSAHHFAVMLTSLHAFLPLLRLLLKTMEQDLASSFPSILPTMG
jgi:hypothetical protein